MAWQSDNKAAYLAKALSNKEEPGLDANRNMDIYQEQSTSSLYQEDSIHISSKTPNTHTWPNGDKYVGEWKDGKKHGQGTHTWPSGKKYEGKWRDGKFVE